MSWPQPERAPLNCTFYRQFSENVSLNGLSGMGFKINGAPLCSFIDRSVQFSSVQPSSSSSSSSSSSVCDKIKPGYPKKSATRESITKQQENSWRQAIYRSQRSVNGWLDWLASGVKNDPGESVTQELLNRLWSLPAAAAQSYCCLVARVIIVVCGAKKFNLIGLPLTKRKLNRSTDGRGEREEEEVTGK